MIDAVKIGKLKRIGFSFTDMKAIFEDNESSHLIAHIDKKIDEIESMVVDLNVRKANLQRVREEFIEAESEYSEIVEQRKNQDSVGLNVSFWPGCRAVITDRKSEMCADFIWWERVAELEGFVSEEGLSVAGPLSSIIHEQYLRQFFFEEGEFAVFFPVSPDTPLSDHVKDIEGRMVASKLFKGPYKDLLPTYVSLVQEIEDSEYEICGDPLEEYLLCWTHGVSQDDFITRVSFPVKLASA